MTQHHARTVSVGDLTVNRIGFGAMRLTGEPGSRQRETAMSIARRAVELGVGFIDTADSYGLGRNEELLAEALYPYRSDTLIATKGGQVNLGRDWIPLGRPEYVRQQAELSLRRLRRDRIDLYQLHRIDPMVPLADQIGALALLREQGKIRHAGLSEVTVEQLTAAETIMPIASVQNRYGLTERAHADVLAYCAHRGIAFVPWLPVAPATRATEQHVVGVIDKVASKHHASRTQVALAWLLRRSAVVLPIPGTSSLTHLEENVAAGELAVDDADLAELDALVPEPATSR